MSAPAATKATFADFRIIKGRKQAQLVFEVPIEQADAALIALGGLPRSDDERWCAIARLDLSNPASAPEKPRNDAPKERKPFTSLPPSQQAAMRCNEPDFQRFLGALNSEDAAALVREHCAVTSRADLNTNWKAAERWKAIDADYYASQHGAR